MKRDLFLLCRKEYHVLCSVVLVNRLFTWYYHDVDVQKRNMPAAFRGGRLNGATR